MDTSFILYVLLPIGIFAVVAFSLVWISEQKKSRPSGGYYYDPEMKMFVGSIYDPSFEEVEPMTGGDYIQLENWEAEQEERAAMQYRLVQQELDRRRRVTAEREQERREIEQTFPTWLVTFGDEFGLTSMKKLTQLSQYITAILLYGQQHFDGSLPIKRCYNQANEDGFGYPAPDIICYGRTFFERLSKALAKNGLLEDGRGTKGRFIAQDAFLKLRPASSVQCPSSQYTKMGDSDDLKFLKPDEAS